MKVSLAVVPTNCRIDPPLAISGELPDGRDPQDAMLHLMYLVAIEAARRSDPERVIVSLAAGIDERIAAQIIELLTPSVRVGDVFTPV